MEKVVLPLVIVAYIVFLIYKAKSNKRRYATHPDGESMRAREHNLKRNLGVTFISIGIIILPIAIVYYNENKEINVPLILGLIGVVLIFYGIFSISEGNNDLMTQFIKKQQNIGTEKNCCTRCGEIILLNTSFCPNCGEFLKTKCPNCNSPISEKDIFCSSCGNECNRQIKML